MPENKIQITIEAIDKAKAALDSVAKDMGKLRDETQKTGQASQGLGGTLASLKQSWVGLSIGINQALEVLSKVRQAGAAVYDFAKEGQKVILVETAFKHMAQSVGADAEAMIGRLKAITKGVMDDTDLMQRATEMMLSGVKPEKIESLTEAMMKLAPYAGMTLPEALGKVGTALETGNARAIKSLIGYIDLGHELDVYAQKLGKTSDQLTDQARVQASMEIILDRAKSKTKGLVETHELGINTFLRFETAWKNMIEDMQKGVGPLSELVQWMTKLIEKFNEFSKRRKEAQEEFEARKEFAGTPQGESMLGAIGTARGQGYEKAFQEWYAQQTMTKEYQRAAEAQDQTLAARTGAAAAGTAEMLKPATRLEKLQKEAILIQSLNDEESKRKEGLDRQVAIMKMQVKGISDQEAEQFKNNELAKIGNEFAAKRLLIQAEILKEQGLSVEALELQKEAELTLATNDQQRFDLTKKWNLEIANAARAQREQINEALMVPRVEAYRGFEEMMAMTPEQTREKIQEVFGIINQLYGGWERFQKKATEKAEWFAGLPEAGSLVTERLNALTDVYREFFEKAGAYAREYAFYREKQIDEEIDALDESVKKMIDIEAYRAQKVKQIRIEAGTAGEGESFLYGWKQQEIEWGNTSKNMVQMARDSAEAMRQAFEDGFFTLMTGKFKDLRQVAISFLNDLARSIARMLSKEMASGTLSLLGGLFTSGSGGAYAGSYYGAEGEYGIMHAGHPGPETYRLLPSKTFFRARRYHEGLGRGEVPAILKDDEWVFTKEQIGGLARAMRRGQDAGAQVNQSLTIHIPINLNDPKLEERLRSRLEKAAEEITLRTLKEQV
jgi:hypothetical protein